METDRHYILVGMFVLAAFFAAIGFGVWLTGQGQGDYVPYRIRFADSVSGLNVGGAVKYRGLNIGTVRSMEIDPQDTRFITVDIDVLKTAPIKTDTVASLKLQGITGTVFVELKGGDTPGAPNLADSMPHNGVPEIPSRPNSINAAIDRLPQLLDRAAVSLDQLNKLISDRNVETVTDILTRWRGISETLVRSSAQFDELLRNGKDAAANLRDMTRDSSAQLDVLMRDMRKITHRVDGVTEKLEENPSSLIFGRKEKGVPAP